MKYSIVIDDNSFVHIARNLLTVYQINYGVGYDTSETIELFNLCYIKSQDEFCVNRLIQLPERLRKRYNGAYATDEMIQEMESIGIININLISKKIELYEECKDFIAYQDYRGKLLNQNYNYVEVIEQMNLIKDKLLETHRNEKGFQLEKRLIQGGTNERL